MKLSHVLVIPILTVQAVLVPFAPGKLGFLTSDTGLGVDSLGVLATSASAPSSIRRVPGQLRGVVEDSGICETTNGVHQASGYVDISEDGSIWFWFFAARNNPDTAPLALWFNGGPGSSSMIGLTQENGPCRINNDSDTVSMNPYSWNERANLLYIDQPAGVGFSTGTRVVGTSAEAARDIWTFMQIWLSDSRFSQYQNRDLAIWTESYGGHYGPSFATYFLSQNADIAAGRISGITLNLKTLAIGNGLTDPIATYQGIIDYASSNPYRIFNSTALAVANDTWTRQGGCRDSINTCNDNGTDAACFHALEVCNTDVINPLLRDINVYYVPNPSTDPYPRNATSYLNSIMSTIGADVDWAMTSSFVYSNFIRTGDWMRDSSPELENVINAGVRTLIYDGDADLLCNYKGVELLLDSLNTTFSDEWHQQEFQNWTVSGQVTGLYKNAGTLSYVRVYGAGHEVPAYTYGNLSIGQAALQMFNQIMENQSISNNDTFGGTAVGGNGSNHDNSAQDSRISLSLASSMLIPVLAFSAFL